MLPQVVALQHAATRLQPFWVLIIIPLLCVFLLLTHFSVTVDIYLLDSNFLGRLIKFSIRVVGKAFSYALLSAVHGTPMLV